MKNLKKAILALFVLVAFVATTNAANRVECKKANNQELLDSFKKQVKKGNTLDLLKKGEKADFIVYGEISSDNNIHINRISGKSNEIKEHLLSNHSSTSEKTGEAIVFKLTLVKH